MFGLWRIAKGITIRQMAKEIGVSIALLSRFENGHQIKSNDFQKILFWIFWDKQI